jgi:hypothetical protein
MKTKMMKSKVLVMGVMVVLLAISGLVQAASITYSIIDYPDSEWDYYGTHLQDRISGTIIADPLLPDGENILSAAFTLSQPGTGQSYTSSFANTTIFTGFGPYPQVTPSAITVSDGLYFDIDWTNGAMLWLDGVDTATGYTMEMIWNQAGPQYSGGVWMVDDPYTQFLLFGTVYVTTPQNTTPDNANIANQVSTWVIATAPTAITLASFEAKAGNRKVTLIWETATEINNAGFNILRAESENGEYVQINKSLIPAQGTATQGSSYMFVDTEAANRMTYYYKLEDIDLNGSSTMHGPVNATPRLIFGGINR